MRLQIQWCGWIDNVTPHNLRTHLCEGVHLRHNLVGDIVCERNIACVRERLVGKRIGRVSLGKCQFMLRLEAVMVILPPGQELNPYFVIGTGTTLAGSSTRRDGGAVDTSSKHQTVPEKKRIQLSGER